MVSPCLPWVCWRRVDPAGSRAVQNAPASGGQVLVPNSRSDPALGLSGIQPASCRSDASLLCFLYLGGCLCRRAKLPGAGSTWSSGRSPAAHLERPNRFSAPAAVLPSLPLSAVEFCTPGSPPFPSMPYKSLLLGLPAALLHSSSLVSSGPSRIAAAGAQQHPGGCSPSPWGAGCPAGVALPQE